MWMNSAQYAVRMAARLVLLAGLLAGGVVACVPRPDIPSTMNAHLVASGFASPDELVSPPESGWTATSFPFQSSTFATTSSMTGIQASYFTGLLISGPPSGI